MLEPYIIGGIIISFITLVITIGSFFYNNDINPEKPFSQYFQWATMIFSGGMVIAWLWPAMIVLAMPVFLCYGVFSWARAIKHKTIDFSKE